MMPYEMSIYLVLGTIGRLSKWSNIVGFSVGPPATGTSMTEVTMDTMTPGLRISIFASMSTVVDV